MLPPNTYSTVPDGRFKCLVCPDFFVTGIEPMKQHLQGQKHRKALMQQQLASNSSDANQLLPADTYFQDGVFRCKVCPDIAMTGIKPLETHVQGEKHRKALLRHGLPTNGPNSESPDSSLPADTYLENCLYKCKVCPDISLTGIVPLRDHVKGEKHRKALLHCNLLTNESKEFSLPPDTYLECGLYKCRICPGVSVCGIIPLQAHVNGNAHQKLLFKQQNSNSKLTTFKNNEASSALPAAQLNAIPVTDQYFIGDDGSYKCKFCPNFKATGIEPVKEHLKCYKHNKALRESIANSENSQQLNSTDPALNSIEHALSSLTLSERASESIERIEKAWKHEMPCKFSYEKIEMLETEDKLDAASSHFAFIGKDDVIPNLVRFF